MKLLNKTDFEILTELANSYRNVAANIAIEIDANRSYVNTRFRYLEDYGLVRRVGPHDSSGLYEITKKGQLAIKHRDKFNEENIDFDAYLEDRLAESESDTTDTPINRT